MGGLLGRCAAKLVAIPPQQPSGCKSISNQSTESQKEVANALLSIIIQTNAYQESHVFALIFNSYHNAVIFLWSIARSGDSIWKLADASCGNVLDLQVQWSMPV
jgi:hypothetical protein